MHLRTKQGHKDWIWSWIWGERIWHLETLSPHAFFRWSTETKANRRDGFNCITYKIDDRLCRNRGIGILGIRFSAKNVYAIEDSANDWLRNWVQLLLMSCSSCPRLPHSRLSLILSAHVLVSLSFYPRVLIFGISGGFTFRSSRGCLVWAVWVRKKQFKAVVKQCKAVSESKLYNPITFQNVSLRYKSFYNFCIKK